MYISAQLVPFPATCGAQVAGTVFGPYDTGCPPKPPTPYVPPPIPGQCENPPAILCNNCLNGNDLNGNPVNDATRCSDPIYDDPPPSDKVIRYLCNTCGESTVGLAQGGGGGGGGPSANVGSIINSVLEIIVAVA